MKLKMLTIAAVLLAAVSASAQVRSGNFAYRTDYDSTSVSYCRVVGKTAPGQTQAGPIDGTARIKTTGSSVTVVAVTAGQLPFANLNIDDVIQVRRPNGTVDLRVVATKTDGDNITVQTAVNWDQTTGFAFGWWDSQCGTADTDGWIDTSGLGTKVVTFLLEQISGAGAGIDFRIECMGQAMGDLPVIVHPGATGSCSPGTSSGGYCNFTAAGLTTGRLEVAIPRDVACGRVRVGVKIGTSDAAEAAEADKERVTITLNVER